MMNKYDFAESVGMMHEYFIEESMRGSAQMKERIITKWSTLAAGVCLFLSAGLFAWHLSHGNVTPQPVDSLVDTTVYGTGDVTDSDTTAPDTTAEGTLVDTDDTTAPDEETTAPETTGSDEPEKLTFDPARFSSRESIIREDIYYDSNLYEKIPSFEEHLCAWAEAWVTANYGETPENSKFLGVVNMNCYGLRSSDAGESSAWASAVDVMLPDGTKICTALYGVNEHQSKETGGVYRRLSGIEERTDAQKMFVSEYAAEYLSEDGRFKYMGMINTEVSFDSASRVYDLEKIVKEANLDNGTGHPVVTYGVQSYENGILTINAYIGYEYYGHRYERETEHYLVHYNMKTGKITSEPDPNPPIGKCGDYDIRGEKYSDKNYRVYVDGDYDLYFENKKTGEITLIYDAVTYEREMYEFMEQHGMVKEDGAYDYGAYHDYEGDDMIEYSYVTAVYVHGNTVIFNVDPSDMGTVEESFYATYDIQTGKLTEFKDGYTLRSLNGDMLYYRVIGLDARGFCYTDLSRDPVGKYDTDDFLSGVEYQCYPVSISDDGMYAVTAMSVDANTYRVNLHSIRENKTKSAEVRIETDRDTKLGYVISCSVIAIDGSDVLLEVHDEINESLYVMILPY